MLHDAASSTRNAAGTADRHAHLVQFYDDENFLYDAVTSFVAGGLSLGQPAVVFARPESRHTLDHAFSRAGIDLASASRKGELSIFDARATLGTFMRGAVIDEDRFMTQIGGIITSTARGTVVRAFGEMVDVLFRDGNAAAAIRLEELWNILGRQHSFDLLCAYAIGNFYTETHARQLKDICDRHSHVIPAESYSLLPNDQARAQRVIDLQHRARALQVEIEHRKAVESALRAALAERQIAMEEAERANAAKNEFLAVISHELRTPLTAIIGYEELLEQGVGGPVTEQQQAFLGGIRAGASHLLRLIEQILTQSRLSAGKESIHAAPVELVQLVHGCAALMQPVAAAQNLSLTVSARGEVVCHTDAGKVQQIVLNLLSNAIKFTPAGSIDLHLSAYNGYASLDVRDTGVGIPIEQHATIFEPFHQIDSTVTRPHSGVGLGLSVSRNLAQLLGGDLQVKSEVGIGSTFTLTLPQGGAGTA